MSHYVPNVRDIEFNLFELFDAGSRMGSEPFASIDEETARSILAEVAALTTGPVAASYVSADRNPPVYDPASKTVTIPADFKASYEAWMDAEWWRLDLPEHLGGAAATPMLRWAVAEMVLGANPAVYMYAAGPGFAAILDNLGNADQKRLAELMIENRWGSTMVLTEPDAGSDVGAGRTKAVPLEDGSWRIEGVKRFITSGEHDMADSIVHLVLARPEGAGPGTKGLSLFVVPKFHVNLETGELGARNGVYATNVEHKMGLKASATCEMTFSADPNDPAIGWLVGDVHDGIAQMFKVIEYARMMVGTKAMSQLSSGYLGALEYTKTRVQGADMTQMTDKTAPRVTIIHHPDVRRSLLQQKAYAEGLRALVMFAAYWQDLAAGAATSEADLDTAERMNDLLLPIVKGFSAEKANTLLFDSLQLFGGSGFLDDYPIGQLRRDVTIDSLYEGVLIIQASDYFFRKILKDQFRSIMHLSSLIKETTQPVGDDDPLCVEREALAAALSDVEAMLQTATMWAMGSEQDSRELYKVGLNAVRVLLACGDLVVGWLLIRQAEVALRALEANPSGRDADFYSGKLAIARWFARNRLPLLAAELSVMKGTTLDPMEVPECVF